MIGVAIPPMRQLHSFLKSLMDNLPPYHKVEGVLKAKQADTNGQRFIMVNAATIEVDEFTFGRLSVGDDVKVRYTRNAKAISIDRTTVDVEVSRSDITAR